MKLNEKKIAEALMVACEYFGARRDFYIRLIVYGRGGECDHSLAYHFDELMGKMAYERAQINISEISKIQEMTVSDRREMLDKYRLVKRGSYRVIYWVGNYPGCNYIGRGYQGKEGDQFFDTLKEASDFAQEWHDSSDCDASYGYRIEKYVGGQWVEVNPDF